MMLDFPQLHIDTANRIYQYALEACAAAALINNMDMEAVHVKTDVPHVK